MTFYVKHYIISLLAKHLTIERRTFMKNEWLFATTLRRVLLLEETYEELEQISEYAFSVFTDYCSLKEMERVKENAWKKLFYWNRNHENVPSLFIQNYVEVERVFSEVERAIKNRKEFEAALAPSRKAVEEALRLLEAELLEEKTKLNKLYDEFAESSGDFKFIFKEEKIKQLIMNGLMKS